MQVSDQIAMGGAVIALAGVGVSFYFAMKAKHHSDSAQRAAAHSAAIAMGQAETALRSEISVSRRAVRDLTIQIGAITAGRPPAQLSREDRARLEPLFLAHAEAVEDNLNAFEDACGKYHDDKIDRERFRKTYINEIRVLCTQKDNDIAKLLHPEATSHYQALWKLYRLFHVHET